MIINPSRKFLSVTIPFIIVMILIFIFKGPLASFGFDINFLLFANLLLYFICYLSFIILLKGIGSISSHAFVRGLYSSLLLKMIVIAGALFIYIFAFGKTVNIPGIFTAMALYLIYTFIEVKLLMKIARKKTDA